MEPVPIACQYHDYYHAAGSDLLYAFTGTSAAATANKLCSCRSCAMLILSFSELFRHTKPTRKMFIPYPLLRDLRLILRMRRLILASEYDYTIHRRQDRQIRTEIKNIQRLVTIFISGLSRGKSYCIIIVRPCYIMCTVGQPRLVLYTEKERAK